MEFDLLSFVSGGIVVLLGFLAFMAWIVPDNTSVVAMSWISKRRNFSIVGMGIGAALLVVFLVVLGIAFVRLFHLVQMEEWVLLVMWIGLGIFLTSLVMRLLTRQVKPRDQKDQKRKAS